MPQILVTKPVPRGYAPQVIGTLVVVLALPVFLVADWRIGGWVLGAVLWFVGQALGMVLSRMPLGMGSLAGSGAVGFGRMFRAVTVMAILIAVTVKSAGLGLPAAAVYAFAYTAELGMSLAMYYGNEEGT